MYQKRTPQICFTLDGNSCACFDMLRQKFRKDHLLGEELGTDNNLGLLRLFATGGVTNHAQQGKQAEVAAEQGASNPVYQRVKQLYAERFNLEVTEPLGFENTFAMVIRGEDAKNLHLRSISDIVRFAPQWRVGVGYEFLERPDGFRGWTDRYQLHFAGQPRVMDLGLIYRALVDRQVDLVAGNSTDGLIDALALVALEDDRHYFPRYDGVPIVRKSTLERFPQLRATLDELGGKVSETDIRKLNYAVDARHQDPAAVVREFRASKGL